MPSSILFEPKTAHYQEIGIVPTIFNGIPDVQLVLMEKKIRRDKLYEE